MTAASFDVVIAGGGAIGSAIAYFVAADPGFGGTVLVVEKDPTYARASTSLSVGGVRQQFSVKENIEMSEFAAGFFDNVDDHLAVDEPVDLSFKKNGYLFLAAREGLEVVERCHEIQTELGARVTLLRHGELRRKFPWLNVDDIAAGSFGYEGAGWIDPHSLLQAFKKKARSLGVTYAADEVVGLERDGSLVSAAALRSGDRTGCGYFVNAAGPSAARVAEMAGIGDLPVHPKKRCVFAFDCTAEILSCPLVIDPSGVYFRPEGKGFICGTSPESSADPDCEDFDVDYELFDEQIWPVLAHRVEAFDEIRRTTSWAGHYAFNVKDQNAVLGPHPEIANFYFANGFSGHGLQQAPAVGRAISELIVHGSFQTLDLSRLGFDRFARGALIRELGVV